MGKSIKVLRQLVKINIKKMTMYKGSFFFTFLSSFIWLGVPVVTFRVIYLSVDAIGGWKWGEMLFLLGCFQIVDAIVMTVMLSNMGTLEKDIRYGLLDRCLVKPIDAQVYYLTESFNFIQFLNIIFGILLILYSLQDLSFVAVNLEKIVGLVFGLILGVIIYICIWFLTVISCFWFPANFSISELVLNMNAASKYPRIVFEGVFKTIFSTLLPLLMIVSPPVEFFLNKSNQSVLWYQLLIALTSVVVCRIVWKKGLVKYESSN